MYHIEGQFDVFVLVEEGENAMKRTSHEVNELVMQINVDSLFNVSIRCLNKYKLAHSVTKEVKNQRWHMNLAYNVNSHETWKVALSLLHIIKWNAELLHDFIPPLICLWCALANNHPGIF